MMAHERAALVTGTASGIGRAVVETLRRSHAVVVGVDVVSQEPLEGLQPVQCAVEDPGLGERVAAALAGGPPLRSAVHCAGVTHHDALIATSCEQLSRVLHVNVVGTHNVVQTAFAQMRAASPPGGAVVLVSTQLTRRPTPRRGAYTASKAAVERMVPDYARECADTGVRVVGVAPGPVVTGMTRDRFADPREVEALVSRMALDRLCEPQDIANVIEFLVHDEAIVVNGTVVTADGGYLAFG